MFSNESRKNGAFAVTLAALLPTCFAGWLVYESMHGADARGGHRRAQPPPSASSRPASSGRDGKPSPESTGPASPDPASSDPTSSSRGRGDHPLSGKVIVLDPGHNPNNINHIAEINRLVDIGTNKKECDTTGASTNDGYTEASFTLDVTRRLRDILAARGATVRLTHNGDREYGPCVDERARIGNEAHADAAVSIHADGAGPADRGFHVIVPAVVVAGPADTRPIAEPSRRLGDSLKEDFAKATGSAPANYLGGGTGITVRGDLGGLNLSTVPKVFIECANMRNAQDAEEITDPAWRQRAAQGIADGIAAFLEEKR